jgi:large subunit ribosomal protein L30
MASTKQQLKITLIRGTNKCVPRQKDCVRGLGLRKLRHTVIVEDTPNTRGMINKVAHLLDVQQA